MARIKTTQTSVNSFGTFLETVKKRRSGESPGRGGSTKILGILEKGPEPVPVLMQRSELAALAFMDAFENLLKASLIQITKSNGKEVVELTATGSQVAKLTHE